MASISYEQRDITVPTLHGPRTIPATVASNGLAYHRSIVVPDNGSDRYTVTHVVTGKAVSGNTYWFLSGEQCQRFIEKVDGLLDWHSPTPKGTKQISEKVKQAAHDAKMEAMFL